MRDETLARAKRIVVKIGSSLIASRSTGLRPEQIERLADEIAAHRPARQAESLPPASTGPRTID